MRTTPHSLTPQWLSLALHKMFFACALLTHSRLVFAGITRNVFRMRTPHCLTTEWFSLALHEMFFACALLHTHSPWRGFRWHYTKCFSHAHYSLTPDWFSLALHEMFFACALHIVSIRSAFHWRYTTCFSHAHSTLSHYGVLFTGVTQNVFRMRTTPHSPRSGFRWHYAKCFSLVRRKKNHSPRAENTPLSHATAKSTSSTPGVFSIII